MINTSTNLTFVFALLSNTTSNTFITDMVASCAGLFFGICSLVANGIILALAALNKSLRKDPKRIQVALSIADLILGLGQIVTVFDKWRIQFWNDWYTAYYCSALGMISFLGDTLSVMFTFDMGIERMIAIWYPIWYRTSNRKALSYSIIFSSMLLVIVFCGCSLYGINGEIKPVTCSGSSVRIASLKPLLSYYNCAVGALVVLVYCITLYGLKVKSKQYLVKFPVMALDEKELYNKEIEATKVVMAVVVGCMVFFIAPNIVVTVVTLIKSDFQAGPYVPLLGLFQASLNFILYLWKDKSMRREFLKWFGTYTSATVTNISLNVSSK